MNSLANGTYTIFLWILFLSLMLLLLIPLIICLFLPSRFLVDTIFFRSIMRIFYWVCVKCSFLPISYKGFENFPKEPSLIVANHQSSYDIPLIGYALQNRVHIWLAWAQLLQWPFLRFIVSRVALLVDISSPLRASRSLVQAVNLLKDKPWDLIIFPEGGRYTNEKVHPFFAGFAVLAEKTGRPIVPIKIIGVDKVYPPTGFWFSYYPITIIIGKPLHIQENESKEEFVQKVYNWFLDDSKES